MNIPYTEPIFSFIKQLAVIFLALLLITTAFTGITATYYANDSPIGYEWVVAGGDSMEPQITPPAFVLIDTTTSVEETELGDVVLVRQLNEYYAHTVISKQDGQLITKGINNPARDPKPATETELEGKVIFVFDSPAFLLSAFLLVLFGYFKKDYLLATLYDLLRV